MSPEETIRARLAKLDELKATYRAYAQQRFDEEDWHGLWDAAVNLSEVSCERDGLLLALRAVALKPDGARCGAHGGGGFDCERYPGHPDEHAHWIETLTAAGESAIKVEWK